MECSPNLGKQASSCWILFNCFVYDVPELIAELHQHWRDSRKLWLSNSQAVITQERNLTRQRLPNIFTKFQISDTNHLDLEQCFPE